MGPHLLRTCAGFVSLILLTQAAVAQTNPSYIFTAASPQTANIHLLESVRAVGQLPVIVRLDDNGFSFGGSKSEGSAINRQFEIHQLQNRVLQEVEGLHQSRVYRHIPFLASRVNEETLLELMAHPAVIDIQIDELYEPMLVESTEAIGAQAAWDYGGTGEGQLVAVIDTGVEGTHPFLANKVVDEVCFSTNYASTGSSFESISTCPSGEEEEMGSGAAINCEASITGCDHGTRVAGIVAGKGDEFNGVAKDASLMAIQVFSRFENYCGSTPCVRSWVSDQVAALEYVYEQRTVYPIAAVNLSLGGGHFTTEESCDEVNPAMRYMVEMLRDEGIVVIAAAGNSGLKDGLVAPACLSSSISVGATTKSDVVTSFSSSASFLDLLAPGQGIVTSVPGGGFKSGAGTSFSAPHVAGAWAVLRGMNPDASTEALLEALFTTGLSITDELNDVTTSRIQIDAALQKALLPVELTRFDALVDEEGVEISWETASETNNAGFEIEHTIGDDFTSLLFVPGQGTTAETTYYNNRVEHLAPGWHRFRLKQIDFDGKFAYSLETKVFIDLTGSYHFSAAYPNPFNPTTQFTITLGRPQHVRIEVYNLLGQQVALLTDQALEAERIYPFTLEGTHLPSGVYIIQATGESFRSTRSVTLLK